MTISSISSAATAYQTDTQNPWKQRAQDFKALQSALQSGDLSGAQQAFSALQQDGQSASQTATASQATSATSASSQNSSLSKDFQALQSALSSGDLSGAQQAFASLKQDLQGSQKAHHHHHHHAADASTSGTSAASGTTTDSTTAASSTTSSTSLSSLLNQLA